MKNKKIIKVMILILSLFLLISCENMNLNQNTIETKKEESNNLSINQEEEEKAMKVLDSAMENIKNFEYVEFSNKLSKTDKELFEKLVINNISFLKDEQIKLIKTFLKELTFTHNNTKMGEDSITIVLDIVLFNKTFLTDMLFKDVNPEITIDFILKKENNEYLISNIQSIIDTFSEKYSKSILQYIQ
ncbi:MAG: hypothetical protein Q4F88_03530 [Eubacteriales bacterium]|nr:hypothetical protein [Eubacteriales bacterium]